MNRRADSLRTLCVHAGTGPDPSSGAIVTPIFQSSTYLLAEKTYRAMQAHFARDVLIYSRYGNPSQWAVQEKIAALEGAESAVVFSSGMAAISTTLLALTGPGGHVVASSDLYGGTHAFLVDELSATGRSVTMADARDPLAIEAAVLPTTEALYVEAVSNPLLKVPDLDALAVVARRHDLRFVVDATFATPIGMRCLEHGVDVVIHSASKYLNGHSDLIAGAAAGSRELLDRVWSWMLHLGGSLDPHACFLLERGIKTLAVRMRAHEENALAVARWLEGHPQVSAVFYPLLPSHPDHEVARRLLRNGGGMVSFALAGGDGAALAFLDKLQIPRVATSLGGVESLVSLPFNTSHANLTADERDAIGIPPGCVRLSVGIEDPTDLIADLGQAIDRSAD